MVSPSKTPKVVTITVDGLGLFGLVVVAGEVVLVAGDSAVVVLGDIVVSFVAVVGTVVVVGEVVAWVVLLVVDVLVSLFEMVSLATSFVGSPM